MATKQGDAKGSEGGVASLLNVVPTIYYDLIARICPGLAFWLAISVAGGAIGQLAKLEDLATKYFLVALVLSYLAGIVLTGASVLWDLLSFAIFWVFPRLRSELALDEAADGKSQGFFGTWQAVTRKMESIAKENASAGGIVTKALAEVSLCQNLLSGFVVLAFLGSVSNGKYFPNPLGNWDTYVPVFLALLGAMLFRQAMFLGRVEALHKTYPTDEAPRWKRIGPQGRRAARWVKVRATKPNGGLSTE
jgi:hypothetical protein